jgi:hypothetical protein
VLLSVDGRSTALAQRERRERERERERRRDREGTSPLRNDGCAHTPSRSCGEPPTERLVDARHLLAYESSDKNHMVKQLSI